MAAEVTKLPIVRTAAAPTPLTQDQRYWAGFSSQQLLPAPNSSPVTDITTNSPAIIPNHSASSSLVPTSSYIAVTSGTRLQLLSPSTLKVVRNIARTSSPFHGASVRRDGRVVLTGSDSGTIQAFDTSSRAILRTWNEHKQPVWVTQWHPRDLTVSMSASDDTTVRLWDLPSETSTWAGYGHSDYVRSGSFIGNEGNMIATGAYDQTVRIWDTRIGRGSSASADSSSRACVMTFALPHPVEAVLPLPGGTTLTASAGPSVAVLDLVAARPLHLLTNHQKTVTSLALATNGSRLLTGALDGHVKAFSIHDWTVVAGFKYASPVLSVAVIGAGANRDDKHLVVGMQSGLLSIRTRLSASAKLAARDREAELDALAAGDIDAFDKQQARKTQKRKQRAVGAGWAKRIRGKDYTGEGADIHIRDTRRRSTGQLGSKQPWELALRRGQYAKALDAAVATRDRAVVITLLTALVHRSALRAALEGRNAATLAPVVRFLCRAMASSRTVRLVTDAAAVVLDLYGEHLGKSAELDGMVEMLHDEVRRNTEVAQMCFSTMGMMEMLKAGAG